MAAIIASYLKKAMAYAEADTKLPNEQREIGLSDEMVGRALEPQIELVYASYVLTSGRQRSYVINLNSAKKSEIRIIRVVKFRGKILAENEPLNDEQNLLYS